MSNEHPGSRSRGFQFTLLWLVSLVATTAVLAALVSRGYQGAIFAAILLGVLLGRIWGRRCSNLNLRFLWSAGLAFAMCSAVGLFDPYLGFERTDVRGLALGGGLVLVMAVNAAAVLELILVGLLTAVRYVGTKSGPTAT